MTADGMIRGSNTGC